MMETQPENKDLKYLMALTQVKDVGVITAKKLLAHYGSAETIFSQPAAELVNVAGTNLARAKAITNFRDFSTIEEELEYCHRYNIQIIGYSDKSYPTRLKHCADSPLVLFAKGNVNLNAPKMVGIVGTRAMSGYGKKVTEELVEGLATHDATIVSGMAYGVDIAAHRAAMEQGLQTIGVLGNSLDRMYPAAHVEYAQEIQVKGGLLSEFMTGTKPDRENFPMRNRIVAGLCDALIVIESGIQGGSMITAELAAGYNRDVFAVPGRIHDPVSSGCNRLIKTNRAALLESVRDLEYIMGWDKSEARKAVQTKIFVELGHDEEKILRFLTENGQGQIDLLSAQVGLSVSTAMVALLNLELNGMVRSLPGKVFELA